MVKNNPESGIKRKCGCCKEYFYINNENIDNAVYYDKTTYHSSCFISMCNKRSKMKKSDVSQKWTWVLDNLESIKEKSYEHLSIAVAKENVFEFIKDAYDVTIIPTTIWEKIGKIYNGTFKGMAAGIPPEHLLDMWKRKIEMLNKIADRNAVKDITMNTNQRINYDLSVLINKYDSYLKWLEKQKILEAENTKNIELKKMKFDSHIIGIKASKGSEEEENDDMSDLVDDIFGD